MGFVFEQELFHAFAVVFVEEMKQAPALGVEKAHGLGVAAVGGRVGDDEIGDGGQRSGVQGVLEGADAAVVDERGTAVAEGVFGFKRAGEALGKPERIIDQSRLNAHVEGNLMRRFVHGGVFVEERGGIGDPVVEGGEVLAGAAVLGSVRVVTIPS